MSLIDALNASVGGMSAQSVALGNISDNVANSQTVGFKQTDTSFVDYVTQASATSHTPGAVIALPDYTNSVEGAITQVTNPTALAISGNGFFPVQRPVTSTTFSPTQYYTRTGDFTANLNGNLVNSAGYVLDGLPPNTTGTGFNVNALGPITISKAPSAPVATSNITVAANVPSVPPAGTTTYSSTIQVNDAAGNVQNVVMNWAQVSANGQAISQYNPAVANEWDLTVTAGASTTGPLLVTFGNGGTTGPAGTIANIAPDLVNIGAALPPTAAVTAALTGLATLTANVATNTAAVTAATTTLATATTGLATANNAFTTATTNLATANAAVPLVAATVAAATTALATATATVTAATAALATATTASTAANAASTAANNALATANSTLAGAYTLSATTTAPPALVTANAAVPSVTTANAAATINLALNFGVGKQPVALNLGSFGTTAGITQFAGTSYAVAAQTQDGSAQGNFSSVTIQPTGNVVINYDNGTTKTVAQIQLADFASPDALQQESGQAYTATIASGAVNIVVAGTGGAGTMVVGAEEGSNVDIATQFTQMIVAQRAYTANSKVVSTVNTMMQDTLNMIQG